MKRAFRAVVRFVRRINSILERYPWLYWGFAGITLVVAGAVRMWAAPISAGPDVGQFWGFAKLFKIHDLDFYRYASGTDKILPVNGWGFVYPPLWLLILRVALLASPGSMATSDMVDSSWRMAMKTPVIASDLAIGGILYGALPGPKLLKLLLGSVWLIHPTSWYNSAIFGQFDAIAAAFLLASVVLLVRGRDRAGFIFAGLAVLTKQHTALPVLLMVMAMWHRLGTRRLLTDCAIMVGMGVVVSVPFMFGGNALNYARAVLFAAQAPGYQLPLVYTFSGSGAVITYLHEKFGWDIVRFLMLNTPILILATVGAAVLTYIRRIRVEQAALIGILLFIGLFYRVNYQYLVIYIPLAIFVLARATGWVERSLTAALIVVPAVWVWLMDVYFWFWYQIPRVIETPPILERLGLTHYVADVYYVILAAAIMLLSLAYVIVILARRRYPVPAKPLTKEFPGAATD